MTGLFATNDSVATDTLDSVSPGWRDQTPDDQNIRIARTKTIIEIIGEHAYLLGYAAAMRDKGEDH